MTEGNLPPAPMVQEDYLVAVDTRRGSANPEAKDSKETGEEPRGIPLLRWDDLKRCLVHIGGAE